MTFVYHSFKCIKCNRSLKVDHYKEIVWCCKVNFKTNPLRLKNKKSKLCPHSFKCINCKEKHQVDSNACLFWKYCFNKEWHFKKYQELHEERGKLFHSVVGGASQ